jgi:hypothetical protein
MSDINCKNCGFLIDTGGKTGICDCPESANYDTEVRRDGRCPAHPKIIEMKMNTVVGRRLYA